MHHTRGKGLLCLLLVLFLVLLLAACPVFRKPGCETDSDCKGDRICETGRCVTVPKPSRCPKPAPCPEPVLCPSCPECPSSGTGSGSLQPELPPQGSRDSDRASIGTDRTEVRGSLRKEIIRRIIRRHINEVKYCYQRDLAGDPGLSGQVVVQFTIAATGHVVMSKIQSSTLRHPEVESCITAAVRRWLFPKPEGGGIVVVSYPFVLKSAQQ